ncbi:hypothetical protein MJO28_011975 [Puccinia striiformis f. sp. tritici]|uniref:Uncharacterized protein n=1 Tax=Puccinia striiformis f. sp. tritici TaxID=168172 RepID=A0ACC0DYP0_9BASI|nr:hypothetical protein MJO28_011975 [Puccinia striiformis f. sp. tritici]
MQRPRLTRILQRTRKLRHQHRRYSRTSTEPTRVAIHVWSRISGFFILQVCRLLALDQQAILDREISIDLFERLPPPFGLSRYGVAPDHPQVKNCELLVAQVAEHPRFRYYGNTIVLGEDAEKPALDDRIPIRLKTLKPEYDVVLLSTIARNVSLDTIRILSTDTQVLAKTDISGKALKMLDKSRVKHVKIVGRSSPPQAAFTTRKSRELIGLPNVKIRIDRELLDDTAGSIAEPGVLSRMAKCRLFKRLLEIMLKASNRPSLPTGSRTTVQYLRPKKIQNNHNK